MLVAFTNAIDVRVDEDIKAAAANDGLGYGVIIIIIEISIVNSR